MNSHIRPWKLLTSINCCTFPRVVFFLLYCELGLLGVKVSPSDICSPGLSTPTKGEDVSTCDLWVVWEFWVCGCGCVGWGWTFLSSWHTRPLFEASHLDYSFILEVSRATKKKNLKWVSFHGGCRINSDPGSGQRRSSAAHPGLFPCMWAFHINELECHQFFTSDIFCRQNKLCERLKHTGLSFACMAIWRFAWATFFFFFLWWQQARH